MPAEPRQTAAHVTDVMSDAYVLGQDSDQSELIRDVLHQWALPQIRVSNIAGARASSAGLASTHALDVQELRAASQLRCEGIRQ
jgi:hypothetical protein